MRTITESDSFEHPGFGIYCDGEVEYESGIFSTREEANMIADAHDRGATTYEEAVEMAKGHWHTQAQPTQAPTLAECRDVMRLLILRLLSYGPPDYDDEAAIAEAHRLFERMTEVER
ncbi:MAG: hypothetical protein KAZ26_19970 [Caldilineaceae bacterium]|nr:hypothetical protein [Caldilineaceae bacterium]